MAASEPLTWSPKLLAFKAARDLYDYEMINMDLAFAKSCFDQISDREYGVIFPIVLERSQTDAVDWCIFAAGAIRYRRCFATGARERLHRSELPHFLSEELLSLHDTLTAIASMNVAHSVNEMELGCTTLGFAVDSDGKLHRGGIGSSGSGSGPLGPAAYKAISKLIESVQTTLVKSKIGNLRNEVQLIVSRMSDTEILALPEGFAPNINQPKYGQGRRWPRPQD